MATDLEIRNQGFKYIPQQQYLLNPFELPTPQGEETGSIGSMSGITNTRAAGPYMGYPSYAAWLEAQGGERGGGAGGDPDEDEGYAGLGMSPGALGGKTPGFTGWKDRTLGNLKHAYSKVPSFSKVLGWAGDKITDWNEARKAKKESDLMDEIREHNLKSATQQGVTLDIGGGWSPTNTGGGGATFSGQEGQTHGGWSNTPEGFGAAAASQGSMATGGIVGLAQGGRIGFNKGGNYAQNAVANQLFGSSFDVLDPFQQDQIDSLISQVGTTSLGSLKKADGGRVGFFYGGLASIL